MLRKSVGAGQLKTELMSSILLRIKINFHFELSYFTIIMALELYIKIDDRLINSLHFNTVAKSIETNGCLEGGERVVNTVSSSQQQIRACLICSKQA